MLHTGLDRTDWGLHSLLPSDRLNFIHHQSGKPGSRGLYQTDTWHGTNIMDQRIHSDFFCFMLTLFFLCKRECFGSAGWMFDAGCQVSKKLDSPSGTTFFFCWPTRVVRLNYWKWWWVCAWCGDNFARPRECVSCKQLKYCKCSSAEWRIEELKTQIGR